MNVLDETHSAALRSFVASANVAGTDFPIQNLPFAVFRRKGSDERHRCGVAIGDQVLDLLTLVASGCIEDEALVHFVALRSSSLNDFMGAGPVAWKTVRLALSRLLRIDSQSREHVARCLVPMSEIEYDVPARIGDYSDFFASEHHARNMTQIFSPGSPLLPNFKWLPIAYHGRASSIEVSGAAFRRPIGQGRLPGEELPQHGPVRWLDYEVEFGIFIGPGNERGEPIPLARAASHLFGVCLLNDWSARDVQAFESAPLGPFLAKSFVTTISPWIVTFDALAPFRCALSRAAGDHRSFDYLEPGAGQAPGLDIQLEAWLRRAKDTGDGTRLSRTSTRHMYWAPSQLVVHHTEGGCNLRPGDLLGSGTQSGPLEGEQGCLMELTRGGTRPFRLPDGDTRAFLEDGDTVTLKGSCEREGFARIGFGDCIGTVSPALAPRGQEATHD